MSEEGWVDRVVKLTVEHLSHGPTQNALIELIREELNRAYNSGFAAGMVTGEKDQKEKDAKIAEDFSLPKHSEDGGIYICSPQTFIALAIRRGK